MVFMTPSSRRKDGTSENCSFAAEARVIHQAEKAGTLANTAGGFLPERQGPSREPK